jgi:hypothetical protein
MDMPGQNEKKPKTIPFGKNVPVKTHSNALKEGFPDATVRIVINRAAAMQLTSNLAEASLQTDEVVLTLFLTRKGRKTPVLTVTTPASKIKPWRAA